MRAVGGVGGGRGERRLDVAPTRLRGAPLWVRKCSRAVRQIGDQARIGGVARRQRRLEARAAAARTGAVIGPGGAKAPEPAVGSAEERRNRADGPRRRAARR